MIGRHLRGVHVIPTMLMSGETTLWAGKGLESWILSWAAAIAGEPSLLKMDKEGEIIRALPRTLGELGCFSLVYTGVVSVRRGCGCGSQKAVGDGRCATAD